MLSLTLHHFLSHVVIVFEPCILFCLVVTSAIELVYSITLVVTCFKLFHFKRIISAHYLQAYKRTLSLDRVQSRSSLSNVRLDETKSCFGITLEGGTITPLFAGHVAFLNANVFDPLTSLEEHASLHRIHSKSTIFNFVYFPIEWSSVLYFHSSHRLIL